MRAILQQRPASTGGSGREISSRSEASQAGSPAVSARIAAAWLCWLLLPALAGCVSAYRPPFEGSRPFDFQKDTFAYANDLVWEYHFDEKGKWVHHRREPQPDYTHHCFVVARSARQFFENARFDPSRPVADEAVYRKLIRQVISRDPARALPPERKVVIPGYPDLRAFSQAQERLLKEECGGAWHSYLQRGHWRMIFPISHASQERTAKRLLEDLRQNCPPVVHVVCFPQLTINHAVLLFGFKETEREIQFEAYDPNKPNRPAVLTFDRTARSFSFPGNDYFPGGRVKVYEIYRTWNY